MSELFPTLFSPITLGGVTVRNRIVSSGHDTMLAEHGFIGDDLVAYHERRAAGGAGLIVLQVSGVHETARYTNHVLMATDEASVPGYTAVAEAVHRHGATIVGQLFHPGREVMDGEQGMSPQSVAPSDEPQERFHVIPQTLTTDLIEEIIAGYGSAAARMTRAGIDGIEIVASHGYLPIQFANPRVNTRTDQYGGSFENRARFLLEAIASARAGTPEGKIVGVRISASELVADGMEADEFTELIRAIDAQGAVDYISVTAGTSSNLQGAQHITPSMQHSASYLSSMTQSLKKVTDIPIMLSGRINQPHEAETALTDGSADLCIMTRAMICDPEMAGKATRDAVDEIRACIGCNQACIGHFQMGVGISCIQHPESGRELTFLPRPRVRQAARLLVVGGGPAGLKAAAVAAEAGAKVLLLEKKARVGGLVHLAEKLPTRAEFGGAATNLEAEARRAGVEIRTSTEASAELVTEFAPDQVILATGSVDREPAIETIDDPKFLTAREFLAGDPADVGSGNILVTDWRGDWVGLGVALMLAQGRKVTLATSANFAGAAMQQYTRTALMGEAIRQKVQFVNDARLVGLDADTAYLQSTLCDEVIEVEDVSCTILAHAPKASVPDIDFGEIPTVRIGDCKAPRTVEEAVYEGLTAATDFVKRFV